MVSVTRATAMLVNKGILVFGEVSFISSLTAFPSFFSIFLCTSMARSFEKPTLSFCLLIKEKGGEAFRTPIVKTPEFFIFSRVGSAATATTIIPRRNTDRRTIIPARFIFLFLLDLNQFNHREPRKIIYLQEV